MRISFVLPISTIRPLCITAILSLIFLAKAMSWVTKIMARPILSCRFMSSFRILAWTLGSKADVGSSAINSLGPRAKALAMATRCTSPPES